MSQSRLQLDLDAVGQAHDRIRPHVHRTPIVKCETLNQLTGCELFLKCENFQKSGAFKFRGATNTVFSLSNAEAERGVVTHSSGNHGAALARAARARGIPATVVMPKNAPAVKQNAVRSYGATTRFCEPTLDSREATADEVIRETGGILVHPYNDERIICGQATAAVELLEQVPDLDAILTPVGGGGMLSGTLLTVKLQKPKICVVGCEPKLADDAYRSWKSGSIEPVERTDTIADGLRTALGDKTFPIIQNYVDEIALAEGETILKATWLFLERAKIVVEPSAAITLAVLLDGGLLNDLRGKRVALMLTGGNIDLRQLKSR